MENTTYYDLTAFAECVLPFGRFTSLSEGWLAVPKEAADTVLEEQHVKMGIHGWVFSAHLREHSSRYVSHALWPRLSSTLSRSSRVLVYSAKGYYECEAA